MSRTKVRLKALGRITLCEFSQVLPVRSCEVGAPILALAGPTANAVTFTFTDPALFVQFFVRAVNTVGTGPASANSNIVVPR